MAAVAVIGVWFALPFICWLLMARTAKIALAVDCVLVPLFVAEVAVARNWIFSGEKFALLVGLGALAIASVFAGFVVEKRLGEYLIWPGALGMAGLILYTLAFLAIIPVLYMALRPPMSTQDVLPLGDGLTTTTSDPGCDGSGNYACMMIAVRGPAGTSPSAVPGLVFHQLDHLYGWRLSSEDSGGWREIAGGEVCVGVSPASFGATISLSNGC
jgi:hypothetical protein